MTTAFEISLEEGTYDIEGFNRRDEVRRQAEHIGIIMLTRQLRQLGVPAQRRTDTLMLVASHGDTVAGRADSDTELIFSFLHSLRHRMGEIRVITALVAIATEIFYFSAVILQEELDSLLESKSCVVTGQRNRHFTKWFHIVVFLKFSLYRYNVISLYRDFDAVKRQQRGFQTSTYKRWQGR